MTALDAAAGTVAADLAAPRRMLTGEEWVEAASGAVLTTEDSEP